MLSGKQQDLKVGERIVLGLTETKWFHGEASKLGNLKQGMKPSKLSLSAGVFLCLGCKTRMMVLVSRRQWEKVLGPQRWQDRHISAMGGYMLHVAPAFRCRGEALRASVMLSSCPVMLWSMLWPVEICL